MFNKVLIANRGEIACRVIRTCRRLGIVSVAVYSDADADALHVRLADEAHRIGPPPARDSYLRIDRIIEAAQASGAQAVHPGYGFLAENPQLALQADAAGLVFIGPSAAAMQAMSSKATARELMQRSGVPVLPGYQGDRQDERFLLEQAEQIGFPVLIKPVAGGGGKGMHAVDEAAHFAAALAACQREARASFADGRVLLEKYLPAPRHIEVQVFGDHHGSIVHLFERDCSAQRRHQKVIEEAPAPNLRASQREAVRRAACAAARAVGYRSAGTVEFLLDRDGTCYFIEMNTRIQVEHPVTEMITGIDLVEWQLRIAAAEPLPLSQADIQFAGHAIEARLYAEDPEAGFLPSSGLLHRFDLPASTRQLRLDSGVQAGDRVGIEYDPMLAKLIVHAETRAQALAALQGALSQVRIAGVANNLLFLRHLLGTARFRQGQIDTEFIEREQGSDCQAAESAAPMPGVVLAAVALWTLEQERAALACGASPWESRDGWRLNGQLVRTLLFDVASARAMAVPGGLSVQVHYRAGGLWLQIGDATGEARLLPQTDDFFTVRFATQAARLQIRCLSQGADSGAIEVVLGLTAYRLRYRDPLRIDAQDGSADTNLAAPMPGRIIAQLVVAGESVQKGTALLIMEAMKMEHTLRAPADGIVRAYRAELGAQVAEGTQLVDFEPRP